MIDRHIPPPPRAHRSRKYPFADMKPGDSAFFPGENKRDKQHPAFMVARNYVKRKGWRIMLRSVTEGGVDGVRIWRVE